MTPLISLIVLTLSMSLYAAEQFHVKIIDRQDNNNNYTYFIPGHSNSAATTDASCFGSANLANCSATTRTTTSNIPARTGSYQVHGATLDALTRSG